MTQIAIAILANGQHTLAQNVLLKITPMNEIDVRPSVPLFIQIYLIRFPQVCNCEHQERDWRSRVDSRGEYFSAFPEGQSEFHKPKRKPQWTRIRSRIQDLLPIRCQLHRCFAGLRCSRARAVLHVDAAAVWCERDRPVWPTTADGSARRRRWQPSYKHRLERSSVDMQGSDSQPKEKSRFARSFFRRSSAQGVKQFKIGGQVYCTNSISFQFSSNVKTYFIAKPWPRSVASMGHWYNVISV